MSSKCARYPSKECTQRTNINTLNTSNLKHPCNTNIHRQPQPKQLHCPNQQHRRASIERFWCRRQSANHIIVSAHQFSNRMSAQPTNTATLNTAHQSDQYLAIAIVSPTLDRPANQDSAGMKLSTTSKTLVQIAWRSTRF